MSETITKTMLILTVIAAVVIFALAIFRAVRHRGMLPKSIRRTVGTVAMSLLLVVLIVCNALIYNFNNVISLYFDNSAADEEALAEATEAGEALVEEIAGEGIVLLENKNDVLPLEEGTKINIFGYTSVSMVYGGSGSGSSDESDNVTLQEGLENAGFEVNTELLELYETNLTEGEDVDIFNLEGGDYNIYEPGLSEYSDELIQNAIDFSDVAIVIFGRCGGEGGDLPMDMDGLLGGDTGRHYLELQTVEEELLAMVEENFETVIVLVDSSNAMELGFLEDDAIDAALWIGGPGSTGCNAIGSILAGTVNPSGRLVDTYAYDATSSPAYYNAGSFQYTNTGYESTDYLGVTSTEYYCFVNYAEGIYVGYRYYETAAADGFIDYDETVQYPFGYGLSYTTFEQEITGYEADDDVITVTVTVTNTGDTAGKEVVQLYYSAPYYTGGIEKAEVVLAAYDKTEELEPGASEELVLTITVEDMASYDYEGYGCYVLEEGTYEIRLMNNSHDLIDSREYEIAETIVYDEDNKRDSDEVAATNQFDDVAGDVVYVSRADWEGTFPAGRTESTEASDELIEALTSVPFEDDPDAEDITFADNGLTLDDMVGLDYDDPQWDLLLEELSIDDMVNLIGYGGFATPAVESIGKKATVDIDGPAGLNGLVNGVTGVQYCSEVLIASTWNNDLSERMGECLGAEALAYEITGLYAPGLNIHRTPFSGRNFEYYSEDSYLSGMMGASFVRGINSQGVYCYAKHFACNDQESERIGLCVWANEQSLRELYFRSFEIVVKEGGTNTIMSSLNRLGTTWTGASEALMTQVLRNEWGFVGMVVSDFAGYDFQDPDAGVRAGNDLMLSTTGWCPTELTTESAAGRQALREACHNILYVVANSAAMNNSDASIMLWEIALILLDVVVLAAAAVGMIFNTRSGKKKEKAA